MAGAATGMSPMTLFDQLRSGWAARHADPDELISEGGGGGR